MKEFRKPLLRSAPLAAVLVVALAWAAPASAQAIIKVNDNVNFKLGILLQGWADWQQLNVGATGASSGVAGATDGFQQNLFIRRIRLLFGGQVAKNVTFFVETDNPNLGKQQSYPTVVNKSLASGFFIQDAFVEWKIANEFMLDGGLILIPLCRNCTESAASQLTLDYGSFSFLEGAPTQSNVGRDTGFQAKGYFFDNHLEYRAGVYQGVRLAGSRNAFRFTGRLMYAFLEPEVGPFYAGTYLGKKKTLTIGASYDTQMDYKAYGFDGFFDYPIGGGNGLTAEIDYVHYDGGVTFATLPKQGTFMGQVGVFFGGPKLMPFFRYEDQSLSDDKAAVTGNSRNIQAGLTWYPYGHNFNIRGAYTSREKPNTTNPKQDTTSEFTIQVQLFYF